MRKYLWIITAVIMLNSCTHKNNEVIIAISKASGSPSSEQYKKWINEIYPEAVVYDLYSLDKDSVNMILAKCDGLVLSGGPDVFPGRYGAIQDTALCSVDLRRDTLEFLAIKKALKRKVPILAICRGEQIFNVALGGTLIRDIPLIINSQIHQDTNNINDEHMIYVLQNSLLHKITGITNGIVNTSHHQSVEYISKKLKISAVADDGVIEAIEWRKPQGKSYLLAVQWHPERLEKGNPMTDSIGTAFIREVKKYKLKSVK
ncbi:MAG: gamma-glutamyl-gamma-aminobutyrate hydrolase family protein [bacterium]